MLLAILSDTHGLLRPELLAALRDPTPDHILHAGDVGDPAILTALRAIAPVTAIRGNIDTAGPCAALPATEALELAGCLLYMLHNLADLDLNPAAAGISVVIYGHSHQPSIETRNNVLYLNPGSAGPRRFSLPITFARLYLKDAHPTAELVSLQPPAQTS
jgi:putative phosphoesterase